MCTQRCTLFHNFHLHVPYCLYKVQVLFVVMHDVADYAPSEQKHPDHHSTTGIHCTARIIVRQGI